MSAGEVVSSCDSKAGAGHSKFLRTWPHTTAALQGASASQFSLACRWADLEAALLAVCESVVGLGALQRWQQHLYGGICGQGRRCQATEAGACGCGARLPLAVAHVTCRALVFAVARARSGCGARSPLAVARARLWLWRVLAFGCGMRSPSAAAGKCCVVGKIFLQNRQLRAQAFAGHCSPATRTGLPVSFSHEFSEMQHGMVGAGLRRSPAAF